MESSHPAKKQKKEVVYEVGSWGHLITTTKAKDLARQQHPKLVVLDAKHKFKEALELLAKNDVISAPVLEDGKFVGFLDVLDIAGYALHTWRKQMISLTFSGSSSTDEFFLSPIKEAINFSHWNYPVYVMEDDNINTVIDAFVSPLRHFKPHRVGVQHPTKGLTNILSQTDIITFSEKNIKALAQTPMGSKTIKELALAHAPIVVRIDTYFSDALRLLYDNRISGIALIDHEGRLSANLSASDLRGLTPESFDLFSGSVLQFMAKAAVHKPHAPITCKETETLTEVVKKLHENHIHRVYIVDENERPTGVVSISDVLLALRPN